MTVNYSTLKIMRSYQIDLAVWLLVTFAFTCPLVATSIRAEEMNVGIAAVDITPPQGYPISGYYYERKSTGMLDALHAKAIVLIQGDTKAAIVICDVSGIHADLTALVRPSVNKATGIPQANIMLVATHSHTGPDYGRDLRQYYRNVIGQTVEESPKGYVAALVDGIVRSIVQAHNSARPVRLETCVGEQTGVSFNRRFVMNDGSVKTWANYANANVLRAAGPIDPELSVLLLRTAGDRKPVGVLSVFALHLDTTGGTKFSADFPVYMQRALRNKWGSDFTLLFAAGTCGDINHVNPRSRERNPPELIGSELATTLLDATQDVREVQPSLAIARQVVHLPLQNCTPDELKTASELIGKDAAGEKVPFLDLVKAYQLRYVQRLREGPADTEADAVGLGWAPSVSISGVGDQLPVEVQVIRLGPKTAIVGLPGEVFVELGLAIKRGSPFRHTMVIELANSNETIYIPTRLAYQGGGYEAINTVLKPGGGEQLVDTALKLLRKIKSAPPNPTTH